MQILPVNVNHAAEFIMIMRFYVVVVVAIPTSSIAQLAIIAPTDSHCPMAQLQRLPPGRVWT